MSATLDSIRERFAIFTRTIGLVYQAAPASMLAWFGLLILQGLLPIASVQLTRMFVDSLNASMQSGQSWLDNQGLLLSAGLIAGIMVLNEIIQGLGELIRTVQSERVQDKISDVVFQKAAAVDLAHYESAEYHDRLYRVANETRTRPLALLESTGIFFQNGLTLVGMMLVLVPYSIWLPFLLLLSALPALLVVYRANQRNYQWWEKTTQDRRWVQYFANALTNIQGAAELRLFNLGDHFRSGYALLRKRLAGENITLARRQGLERIGAGISTMLLSGIVLAWMVWGATQGRFSLGDLALIYQAINNGQSLFRSLLSNLGQIYNNTLFINNLFEFLEIEPEINSPADPHPAGFSLQKSIQFNQVTFRYPGSKHPALENFSLEIPAGRVVAIVGVNGAGKSTFLKLLCRLYDPEQGQILLDGVDIRRMKLDDLRRNISVLFQDPVPYHATAADNIRISDLSAQNEANQVTDAARASGAHEVIEHFPAGYNTLLGKYFADGVELSAGEWQRVALARAYYRNAQIVILDEPTSFMDPWNEAEWFQRLQKLVTGKTAVLITHRFTIAMRADMIYVMRAGQVIESGTHAGLLAQNGFYARSWHEQMSLTDRGERGEAGKTT